MGMCGKDLADAYEMIGDWPLLAQSGPSTSAK
jgi:hypothetical protein